MAKSKKFKFKKGKEEEKPEDNSLYSRFIGGYARSQRKERTPEQKKEYKKLALFLVVWFVFVSSVYYAGIRLEESYWISHHLTSGIPVIILIYMILGFSLFFVWLIFNGGFKKIDLEKFEKPAEMGYDEYCRRIEQLKERQRKSKYFLILFLPFIVVMLVDFLIIVWGAKLSGNTGSETTTEAATSLMTQFINLII